MGRFDFDVFSTDMEAYMKRWNLTVLDMENLTAVSRWCFYQLRARKQTGFSLETVCRIADVCDLDLNKYVRRMYAKKKGRKAPA